VRQALEDSERISELLKDAKLTQDWAGKVGQASVGQGQGFVGQMQQVAGVIASREAFEAERDVFYVELGGFDTHADYRDAVATRFNDINVALTTFVAEMKAQGVWDQVAVQSVSEFGRTIATNGVGTDHAWGGNHFLIGGGVNGGTIHGQYPELRVDGPQSVSGSGPMLPTSPWEAIWKPLATWMGVEDTQLAKVMPNLHAFKDGIHLPKDVFS